MRIVSLGHLCIDTNISEHASYSSPGGPAYYMHKFFRQLPDVHFTAIAPYGNDFLLQAGEMEKSLYPKQASMPCSLHYENTTKIHGDRVQHAQNREAALPIPLDKAAITLLKKADCIIISPLLPNFSPEYVRAIRKHAGASTPILLLPQGYFRTFTLENRVFTRDFIEAGEILPLVDFVLVSWLDRENMYDLTKLWSKSYDCTFIVTLGERGAAIVTKQATQTIQTSPIPSDEIVDSVGSGDTFGAAFLYWYQKTKNIQKAVGFANAIAGQKLLFTPEEIAFDITAAKEQLL